MNNVLPAVPDGWRHSHLEDLAFLDREKLSEGTNGSFSFYYIDISAVSEGNLQLPATKILFRGSPSRARKVVRRGDVLMASVRPNLKAFAYFDHTNDDCIASTGFAVLTAKPDVDPCFILASILSNSVTAQIESHVVGSNYPAINSKDIRRLEILAPPPTQQRKIARILTTVDNLIEKTEALITKYQAIKQGMMHDLFTRGVDKHGHLRPPYEEAPELYKQSELGWIPKEWEVGFLGDEIGPIVSGWSPVCDSVPAAPNEWAILKTTAVVWDGYDESENKRLPAGYTPIASIEVKADDILITRKGPVERVGVVVHVATTRSRLMVPDTVFRVRLLDNSTLLPSFVPLTLGCDAVQRDWFGRKVGLADAQVNVNHGILRRTKFPKPTKDEQHRIVERVAKARARIQHERCSGSKLAKIKTGLMQDLLTGNVPVKTDEAEEVAAHA